MLNQQTLENQNPNQNVSNSWKLVFALFAAVVIGVVTRLELTSIPNVKPIAAMGLWAAFYFRRVWMPAVAIVLTMAFADLILGSYEWPILASVYFSLIFACWLGWLVRRRIENSSASLTIRSAGPRLMIASLAMSTCFYLLTNGMVWACGWYPATFTGLVECYLAGVPFFRFTLLGDLMFTTSGLVAWQLCNQVFAQTGTRVVETQVVTLG